jgi:SAM-dependent methyltransferase
VTTGNYYIDQGDEGQARLRQLAALDERHIGIIERLGIAEGWTCLDLGAGGGSMTDYFCRRVGATGRVVAIDLDTRNLDTLGHANLEVRRVDIVSHDLEQSTYDLVFARAVLQHIPEREAVLDRLVGALRPGGWIVVHDPDFTREHPDDSTEPDLAARMNWVLARRNEVQVRDGVDLTLGPRLPGMLLARGLVEVDVDSYQLFIQGGSFWATFWRRSAEARLRPLAEAGGLDSTEVEAHLEIFDNPEMRWWHPQQVIARGRRQW